MNWGLLLLIVSLILAFFFAFLGLEDVGVLFVVIGFFGGAEINNHSFKKIEEDEFE